MTDPPKTFGRYRLLERIGKGGMAEVYKAKSYGVEGFEKICVIKTILSELAESQPFVDLFIHEAKLAVRLSHANIVQVFDLGITPPAPGTTAAYYMAMEYVHGFDLATLLARCRRTQRALPIEMCVFVAAEVAKGLDHAHRRRDEEMNPLHIVHRDVSPQNVLLSYEGDVKVTDFGIAKARGALEPTGLEDTRARQLQGKFAYMSPEQAAGESVDARSDLFSLGTVLYECVAGVNPFTAPTTFETLRRVQACEYPPIELLRPDAPAELVALLRGAMGKEPESRFPDAARMYEALLAFLYAQGRRFGARDLADFLTEFRAPEESSPVLPTLEVETDGRTPVEIPSMRASSPSFPRVEAQKVVDIERAAGERREVTALVIGLPDREDAAYRGEVEKTLERYGGRVVSREPEQVAALFGVDEPDGRDTEVATRCALVVLRSATGERRPSAGLHTARILVSPDGEPTADERMASLVATSQALSRAAEGRAAISPAAMRQVKSLFLFDAVSDAPHGSSSTTFFVTDVRGPSEVFGKFVGRREELRRIGEILAQATKKRARVLTVRGDHGIGKTRLLVEVERRLKKLGYNVGWYVAACPPSGRQLPLSGLVAMLQVLCGIDDGDPKERILQVRPRLRALGLNEDEVHAMLSALGAPVPPLASATSSGLGEALRTAFVRMLGSLCEDRPHVLSWDAAHWMDDESFAILEAAVSRLKSSRLLVVLSARAGFSHPLERMDGHVSLDLSELDAADVERLVAVRLGVETVPTDLVRFVVERAGGHPQFVEEVLKGLVDARAVTVADRAVVTMRLVGQDLALPKTLRGLVSSRVARLEGGERALLQACAVLGDPIHTAVLARMTGREPARLERALSGLAGGELLTHVAPDQLVFHSPIVREVVEDSLPHDIARDMHAAAGQALCAVLGEKAPEQAPRIAAHFYQAGDRDRAAAFFAKSGERRLEARQLEAGARDMARAIDLAGLDHDAAELAAWLHGLAAAVSLVRGAPEAAELCERVISRVDASGTREQKVRARIDAGRILSAVSQFDAARAQLSQAEYVAEGDAALVKAALVASAELANRQGDFARLGELLERLPVDGAAPADKAQAHKIMLGLAQACAARGDRPLAISWFDRASRLGLVDPASALERHKVRGVIDYFAGDFRAAAGACERAVDLARELGLQYEVAVNMHNLGELLVRLGDFARAFGAAQQSYALCSEGGYDRLANHNRMFLAFLEGVRGGDGAQRSIEQALAYAEACDFTWDVISGRWLLAQLKERAGDTTSAAEAYERLRAVAKASGHGLAVADCEAALARLAGGSGAAS
ncbi:MAG: protein kinase [Myxococcales bacterium]|nr:protein kinase [Myxococcales bacterium]